MSSILFSNVIGNAGFIRSVTLRTAGGRTNRPIARLYPLEVSAEQPNSDINIGESQRGSANNNVNSEDSAMKSDATLHQRPTRAAMIQARRKVAEWTNTLSRPREDVEDND